MNALDPINLTIEFVKQQVDPGGGGEVVNAFAQTGDFAIWAILAIFFVGVIAYCMFGFSRFFNGEYATATVSPRHAKNARGGGRLATTKAVLIAAVIGLIACLSITTTTALAASNHANSLIQPDKIQIVINEETGEVDTASFNFVNTTNDYYLFEKSSVSLSEAAKEISESSDWGLTITGMNTNLFKGEPNGETQTIENSVQTLYPGQTSAGTLTFSTINPDIAKQLIGKTVFNITLDPDQYVITVPKANTDLVYDGSTKTGVNDGTGYELTGDVQKTDAGSYTAIATPTGSYKWPDKTQTGAQIPWSISRAEGSFSTLPEALNNLVYSGDPLTLIKAGTCSYSTDIVYKLKDGTAEYSKNLPVQTSSGTYSVLAHVKEDANHFQSADVEISNINIEKAVISNITVQGSTKDVDYEEGAHYIFPDFNPASGDPDIAYRITDYTVEKGVATLFKPEKVLPAPDDATSFDVVDIPSATEEDLGDHVFELPSTDKWTYNDSNVDVLAGAWVINDGCLTINESSIVSMTVEIIGEKTQAFEIGDSVSYKVSITNKTSEAISGAKLYFENVEKSTINIPAGQTVTDESITYTVASTDFLYYPNMIKKFVFKHDDYSKQVNNSTTLKNKTIINPQLYNDFYDKKDHPFPENVGYSFLGGYNTSKDAGDYYAVVLRNPGYEWSSWPYDIYVYTWTIKKINVDVHFKFPTGQTQFVATFGDDWKVDGKEFEATTTDVAELPDSVEDILGGQPTGLTSYSKGGNVGLYPVYVVLPSASNSININYSVAKTDTFLNVKKKVLDFSWDKTDYEYTGDVIPIQYTVTGNLDEYKADVWYDTYTDSSRSTKKEFKEVGTYYVSAKLGSDSVSANYELGETSKPSKVFKITSKIKRPKAVLTERYATNPKTLTFVYDDKDYSHTPNTKVFDIINTKYDPSPLLNVPPLWADEAHDIEIVTIDETFNNSTKCTDGTTTLTSLDMWFSDMTSLTSIEGLDNIKTKNIKSFNFLFNNCSSLTTIDIYVFKVNSGSVCKNMFRNCSNLSAINVTANGDWTSISSENSIDMFYGCTRLPGYSSEYEYQDSRYAKVGDGGYFSAADFGQGYAALVGNTLKFFTDKDSDMPKKQYTVPTDASVIPWMDNKRNIHNVSFSESFSKWSLNVTRTNSWFKDLLFFGQGEQLVSLNNLNTSNVTDMGYMFSGCSILGNEKNSKFLLGDKFDTSKVENMNSMFCQCARLGSSYGLSLGDKFDTSSVTDMSFMFSQCRSLGLSDYFLIGDKFDTSNVINMNSMFKECRVLDDIIGFSLGQKFDTSNVTDMGYMFSGCGSLGRQGFSLGDKFNTSSVTNMNSMFSGCKDLGKKNFSLGDKFDTSSVTDMSYMFYECTSLTTLNLDEKFNTAKVETMRSMFYNCKALTTLNLGENFNTSNVTTMESMFSFCQTLTTLNLGENFNTSNVTTMESMFSFCQALTTLNLGENFNTSNVTHMESMFSNCQALTTLNLGENFNTSSVKHMESMFNFCQALTTLNLGENFNTSSVKNMESMFYFCRALTTLNLGENFDTSNVEIMISMFSNCHALTTLNLGENFNTSNVRSMESMFFNCRALTILNLGENFNTSNVTTMESMFSDCRALTTLNLGENFNTSNVISMKSMFYDCRALCHIYVKVNTNWATEAVKLYDSSSMFKYCYQLNNYKDSNPNDKTNAHVGTEADKTGYFEVIS